MASETQLSSCQCRRSAEFPCVHMQAQWTTILRSPKHSDELYKFLDGAVSKKAGHNGPADQALSKNMWSMASQLAEKHKKDHDIYEMLRELKMDSISEESTRNLGPQVVNSVFDEKAAKGRADSRVNYIRRLIPREFHPNNLLDFGCGDGAIAKSLGEYYNLRTENVFGCDIIPLAESRGFTFQRIDKDSHEKEPGRLPFEDSKFDLVSAMMSLHHTHHPERYIDELFRVLKPGGYLVIREHDVDKAREPYLPLLLDLIHGLYSLVLSEPQEDPEFCKNFYALYRSKEEWRKMITAAGFINSVPPWHSAEQTTQAWGPQRFYFDLFSKPSGPNTNRWRLSSSSSYDSKRRESYGSGRYKYDNVREKDRDRDRDRDRDDYQRRHSDHSGRDAKRKRSDMESHHEIDPDEEERRAKRAKRFTEGPTSSDAYASSSSSSSTAPAPQQSQQQPSTGTTVLSSFDVDHHAINRYAEGKDIDNDSDRYARGGKRGEEEDEGPAKRAKSLAEEPASSGTHASSSSSSTAPAPQQPQQQPSTGTTTMLSSADASTDSAAPPQQHLPQKDNESNN